MGSNPIRTTKMNNMGLMSFLPAILSSNASRQMVLNASRKRREQEKRLRDKRLQEERARKNALNNLK